MKQDLDKEQLALLNIMASQSSKAISITEIASIFPFTISRRTILRRLNQLIASGKVSKIGQAPSVKYQLTDTQSTIKLSTQSLKIKNYISKPLRNRKPTAYQTKFLSNYQPNQTYYLNASIRAHLQKIGTVYGKQLTPGTYAKRILHRLLIDLSWNSSRLEGNTYSLLETEHLLEFGTEANDKQAFETQMLLNHKDAIEFMVQQLDIKQIDANTIYNIHALLSNNLLQNPKARGRLRQIPVGIGNSVYHPPEIPQLIMDYFIMLLQKANAIKDPFEQAFFLMIQLPYLQPFEDVNKRVSRLALNLPLIKNNLAPLSFIGVPQSEYIDGLIAVYEMNKVDIMAELFVWAYQRSSKEYKVIQETLGEPSLPYMHFRTDLNKVIKDIIIKRTPKPDIPSAIKKWALANITNNQQETFIYLAEQEIASLHEGNIAIYKIKPEDFAKWKLTETNIGDQT